MSQLPTSEPYRSGDYEYDEAHASAELAARRAAAVELHPPTSVATQTPGYDGDYSYDLAHDVPPGSSG
jgi:hypothetical protein